MGLFFSFLFLFSFWNCRLLSLSMLLKLVWSRTNHMSFGLSWLGKRALPPFSLRWQQFPLPGPFLAIPLPPSLKSLDIWYKTHLPAIVSTAMRETSVRFSISSAALEFATTEELVSSWWTPICASALMVSGEITARKVTPPPILIPLSLLWKCCSRVFLPFSIAKATLTCQHGSMSNQGLKAKFFNILFSFFIKFFKKKKKKRSHVITYQKTKRA